MRNYHGKLMPPLEDKTDISYLTETMQNSSCQTSLSYQHSRSEVSKDGGDNNDDDDAMISPRQNNSCQTTVSYRLTPDSHTDASLSPRQSSSSQTDLAMPCFPMTNPSLSDSQSQNASSQTVDYPGWESSILKSLNLKEDVGLLDKCPELKESVDATESQILTSPGQHPSRGEPGNKACKSPMSDPPLVYASFSGTDLEVIKEGEMIEFDQLQEGPASSRSNSSTAKNTLTVGLEAMRSPRSDCSEVPINDSVLSQSNPTPPPKLTFNKRRSLGTPKERASSEAEGSVGKKAVNHEDNGDSLDVEAPAQKSVVRGVTRSPQLHSTPTGPDASGSGESSDREEQSFASPEMESPSLVSWKTPASYIDSYTYEPSPYWSHCLNDSFLDDQSAPSFAGAQNQESACKLQSSKNATSAAASIYGTSKKGVSFSVKDSYIQEDVQRETSLSDSFELKPESLAPSKLEEGNSQIIEPENIPDSVQVNRKRLSRLQDLKQHFFRSKPKSSSPVHVADVGIQADSAYHDALEAILQAKSTESIGIQVNLGNQSMKEVSDELARRKESKQEVESIEEHAAAAVVYPEKRTLPISRFWDFLSPAKRSKYASLPTASLSDPPTNKRSSWRWSLARSPASPHQLKSTTSAPVLPARNYNTDIDLEDHKGSKEVEKVDFDSNPGDPALMKSEAKQLKAPQANKVGPSQDSQTVAADEVTYLQSLKQRGFVSPMIRNINDKYGVMGSGRPDTQVTWKHGDKQVNLKAMGTNEFLFVASADYALDSSSPSSNASPTKQGNASFNTSEEESSLERTVLSRMMHGGHSRSHLRRRLGRPRRVPSNQESNRKPVVQLTAWSTPSQLRAEESDLNESTDSRKSYGKPLRVPKEPEVAEDIEDNLGAMAAVEADFASRCSVVDEVLDYSAQQAGMKRSHSKVSTPTFSRAFDEETEVKQSPKNIPPPKKVKGEAVKLSAQHGYRKWLSKKTSPIFRYRKSRKQKSPSPPPQAEGAFVSPNRKFNFKEVDCPVPTETASLTESASGDKGTKSHEGVWFFVAGKKGGQSKIKSSATMNLPGAACSPGKVKDRSSTLPDLRSSPTHLPKSKLVNPGYSPGEVQHPFVSARKNASTAEVTFSPHTGLPLPDNSACPLAQSIMSHMYGPSAQMWNSLIRHPAVGTSTPDRSKDQQVSSTERTPGCCSQILTDSEQYSSVGMFFGHSEPEDIVTPLKTASTTSEKKETSDTNEREDLLAESVDTSFESSKDATLPAVDSAEKLPTSVEADTGIIDEASELQISAAAAENVNGDPGSPYVASWMLLQEMLKNDNTLDTTLEKLRQRAKRHQSFKSGKDQSSLEDSCQEGSEEPLECLSSEVGGRAVDGTPEPGITPPPSPNTTAGNDQETDGTGDQDAPPKVGSGEPVVGTEVKQKGSRPDGHLPIKDHAHSGMYSSTNAEDSKTSEKLAAESSPMKNVCSGDDRNASKSPSMSTPSASPIDLSDITYNSSRDMSYFYSITSACMTPSEPSCTDTSMDQSSVLIPFARFAGTETPSKTGANSSLPTSTAQDPEDAAASFIRIISRFVEGIIEESFREIEEEMHDTTDPNLLTPLIARPVSLVSPSSSETDRYPAFMNPTEDTSITETSHHHVEPNYHHRIERHSSSSSVYSEISDRSLSSPDHDSFYM